MNEKSENKNEKSTKVLIRIYIFALSLAIILFLFSAFNQYLELRRQWMCIHMSQQMAVKNLQTIQDSQFDIYDYILQKEAFENICSRTGFLGSTFLFLASVWFLILFPGFAMIIFGKYLKITHE